MPAAKEFKEKFTEDYLHDFYIEHLLFKCTPGIDRVTRYTFENSLPNTVNTISRKACNGTYKFTPYKERLLLKGRHKPPRVISIPTIRDKVVLGVLKEIILNSYKKELVYKIVQSIVNDINPMC